MKKVNIEWQRLLVENKTCPRCENTEEDLKKAVEELKKIGVDVELKKRALDLSQFEKAPTESNRILINGRLLEKWLEAETGTSSCCSVCGDNECRTLKLEDKVYENIPYEMIVKAVKKALKL